MKGAILIFGGTKQTRHQKIKTIQTQTMGEYYKDHPDILTIKPLDGKKSIGIDQVRELIRFLTQKPYQASYKLAIIEDAHKLTIPAQNALLKTLEEPPTYATIILGTKTENSLLPTVVSRCQKINVQSSTQTQSTASINLQQIPMGKRLSWAQEKSKEAREDTIEMLEKMIAEERKTLTANPYSKQNIRHMLQVKEDLEETNVNLRLALEFLVTKLG
jgi:DNA polymerase III delta prime subunit